MMFVASIPIWLLAGFLFLIGWVTLGRIYREDYSHPTTSILLFLFPVSWLLASACGAIAAWMVS